MAEIDYQMALLLQHDLEQEYKSSRLDEDTDHLLAQQLQEQFDREDSIDKPTHNLVYKPPKSSLNSSKSLTDPSWELVDPTPDIHTLFIAFNERFFWNRLVAVCVSWSKRMTSCAGICSYQGHGGLCSITLSEPLLKLRPRKDLVETLLHEMIHAYLFVTRNNRDRDGHGPEFHRHMHRINQESGTNITVYHDFHDEVRLYQQHWWRCNGPCQRWKPYFGMVRRAMNRAPGPNDRWWGEHSRNCGGSFIKVKEPEKKRKKAEVNGRDIRDFLKTPTTSKGYSEDFISVRNHWANRFSSSTKRSAIEAPENLAKIQKISEVPSSNQFCSCPVCNNRVKTVELNDHLDVCLKTPQSEETKECPLCSEKIQSSVFDSHVEKCVLKVYDGIEATILKTKESPSVDCLACGKKILKSDLNSHLDDCISNIFEEDGDKSEFNCPFCMKLLRESEMKGHIDACLRTDGSGLVEAFLNHDF